MCGGAENAERDTATEAAHAQRPQDALRGVFRSDRHRHSPRRHRGTERATGPHRAAQRARHTGQAHRQGWRLRSPHGTHRTPHRDGHRPGACVGLSPAVCGCGGGVGAETAPERRCSGIRDRVAPETLENTAFFAL